MAIGEDNRIATRHISLFLSLWHLGGRQPSSATIPIRRPELMALAKISGLATYHQTIRDLDHFGYIRYEPTCNPYKNTVGALVGAGPGPNHK